MLIKGLRGFYESGLETDRLGNPPPASAVTDEQNLRNLVRDRGIDMTFQIIHDNIIHSSTEMRDIR